MIHTVRIPSGVSRLGCAPGGDCCSDCRSDRPRIGDTQCDDSGNCWTDGVLTAAPLTTGTGCAPGVPNCFFGLGSIPAPVWYLGGGMVAALALTSLLGTGGKRRR